MIRLAEDIVLTCRSGLRLTSCQPCHYLKDRIEMSLSLSVASSEEHELIP